MVGFTGHTGSTAFMSILKQHSELRVPALEPLCNREDKLSYTQSFFHIAEGDGRHRVPGFKLRHADLMKFPDGFAELIQDRETRLITLVRENFFKAGLGLYTVRALMDNSAVMGRKVGVNSEDPCVRDPSLCRFEVRNIKFLAYLVLRYEAGTKVVRSIANAMPWSCELVVTYEEFLRDMRGTMTKVYDYLGVGQEERRPGLAKVVNDNPCAVVSNYQEVCAKLWGCSAIRPFLEDPANNCFCADKTLPADPMLCSLNSLLKQNMICLDAGGKEVLCES